MIDILLTINNDYLEQSIVTLNSLFTNNKEENFHIHVIHYDLTKESIMKLSAFITGNNKLFSFYLVKDFDWANGKTRYWDKIILLKLYAWEVLPVEIKKILYLDTDVLVLQSIKELWDIDLRDYFFAMRGNTNHTDLSGAYARHTPTGHTNYVIKKGRYDIHYNAGVILMNLELLRCQNPQWKLFFINNTHRLFCPEEHLICMLWYEKILPIEDKWNQIAQAHPMINPSIIHYIPKPWSDNNEVYYLKEYLTYCDIPECESLYNKILPRINAPYPHSKESLLCSWLQVEIKNPQYLHNFFSNKSYNNIAIYGVNPYSEVFSCKIISQAYPNINYYIVDDSCKYRTYNQRPVYNLGELKKIHPVDCIIVTDYERYNEIETRLLRAHVNTTIISLIEIIFS